MPKRCVANMRVIQTFDTPDAIPPSLAERLVDLSWEGSEMRGYLTLLASGGKDTLPDEFSMSVASISEDDDMRPIGWASAYFWSGMWQLQVYVHEDYRSRGLGTALSSLLLLDDVVRCGPLAVFHDHCFGIAKTLGFADVRQYKSVGDGWIRVEPRHERGAGADPAGLHAPAPEVRDMPLASGEEGALA